jgi:hypothetical protein
MLFISEIVTASELHIRFKAFYLDLECGGDGTSKSAVMDRVHSVTNVIDCVQQQTCTVDQIDILNCEASRSKRDTDDDTERDTVGFSITLTTKPAQG